MRILFSLILMTVFASGSAQDLDYPDYRSKKDNFSKVREADIRTEMASFALAGVDESIGKAPLKSLPITDYGPNYMSFEGNDIHVTVRTAPFDPAKHKLTMYEKHVVKIDGKPYYGGHYGEIPNTAIQSITVLIGKDTIAIPPAAFADLYDPKFSYSAGGNRTRNSVYLSPEKADHHHIYIYMLDIGNAGSEFTWIIQDKQYQRRVVDIGFLK